VRIEVAKYIHIGEPVFLAVCIALLSLNHLCIPHSYGVVLTFHMSTCTLTHRSKLAVKHFSPAALASVHGVHTRAELVELTHTHTVQGRVQQPVVVLVSFSESKALDYCLAWQ